MVSRQVIRPSQVGDTKPHEHDASEISGTFNFARILKAVIDGDIRVTGDIRSSNYAEGVAGWKLSSDGTFQLNGQLFAPDGSAAEPGIATLGNMDTGIFFGDGIGFSVDGTEAGRIVGGQIRMNPGTLAAPAYSFGAGTVTTRAVAVAALSPVAWWRFTGDPGTADSSSTATHTLTFAGSPTIEQSGGWASDEAVSLDGTNDNASVASEGDVERQNTDRSYEFWFTIDADGTGQDYLFSIDTGSAAGRHLNVIYNHTDEFMFTHQGNANFVSFNIEEAEWNHLVVSDDFTTDLRTVYLNGASVGQSPLSAESGSPAVRVGSAHNDSNYWKGDISEAAVYPSALDSQEVSALYHAQSETAQPGITSGFFYDDTNDDLAVSLSGSEVARFTGDGLITGPLGVIAVAERTTDQTGITTEADITGLTATWTAVADRTYKLSAFLPLQQVTNPGTIIAKITDSSNSEVAGGRVTIGTATFQDALHLVGVISPSAGSVTYKVRASSTAASLTVRGASHSAWLIVEDIGPALA